MIIPAQYWSSGQKNVLTGITPQPPTGWIAYAAILPDQPGRYQVTPYTFISGDLCNITPFVRLLTSAQATFQGYLRDFHHRNNLHSQFQVKYFLAPIYRANVTPELIAGLDQYIAKVIYLNLHPDAALLDYLVRFHVSAIIISPNSDDTNHAKTLGLDVLAVEDATPAILDEKIGSRFKLTPQQLEQLGYTGDNTPNKTINANPESYDFGESNLTPYPSTIARLLLPNERLSNDLRKRYVPKPTPIAQEERLVRLIDSAETISAQRLLDYWIASPNATSSDIPLDLEALVTTYKRIRTPDAYDALLRATKPRIREFRGPHNPILCCPALNKAIIDDHLKAVFPSRVRKHLYKAKRQDYFTDIDPSALEPEHRVQLQALIGLQALETEYLSTMLTLYALSSRRPVLRSPQLPSSLFTQLADLRRTNPEKQKASFVGGIEAVSAAFANHLPPELKDYLSQIHSDHLKIISDLPLEWLEINGVPLLYRQAVSRLPITPGNLLFTHYGAVGSAMILDDKAKILIVNCMRPSDVLYKLGALVHQEAQKQGLNVTYTEPLSVAEYWEQLTTEAPIILLHWGHGSYVKLKSERQGYLHIRDEKTPVWGATNVAIPPIVILGACETAAMAESHNTPAVAWLALGARTVLCTYFPVDAALTLTLLVRLIANFSDAVEKNTREGTWSEVVSKTLGLNRYLDFLEGYDRWRLKKGLGRVPIDFRLEYTYRYNKARLSPEEGYHACTALMREAMMHFGKGYEQSFNHYLMHVRTIPHTMFFTQLGSSESIHIRKTREADHAENRALTYWQERAEQDSTS